MADEPPRRKSRFDRGPDDEPPRRSRFEQTEPVPPRRSRFDRERSRSPAPDRSRADNFRERSPLRGDATASERAAKISAAVAERTAAGREYVPSYVSVSLTRSLQPQLTNF